MATPQQIFILGQLRPIAKRLVQTYYVAKLLVTQSTAGNWPNQFPNDPTVIDDGAVSDGRPIVQGNHVRDFIPSMTAFIAYAEGTSPVANPSPLTIWLRLAVNPEQV